MIVMWIVDWEWTLVMGGSDLVWAPQVRTLNKAMAVGMKGGRGLKDFVERRSL